METKRPRKLVRWSAKAATVLIVVALIPIAAITLTDRELDLERRNEAVALALDAAIGVTVEPLDRATAESLGISPRDNGLVITSIGGNGPAAQAGIRAGDVIERIGGIPVGSPDEAAEVLERAPPPDITLTLNRRGHYAIVHLPIRPVLDGRDWTEQGAER